MTVPVRYDWTEQEIRAIHDLPLGELFYRAQTVHRSAWGGHEVQLCSLLSIKTGGCPEDCGYCPQSAHFEAGVKAEKLLPVEEVLAQARAARQAGATRFCMGAAWRQVRDGGQFEQVLAMVRGVAEMGLEVCCTLGMLSDEQARRLADAGLTSYNHNLDTSADFYGQIVTTHSYQERLETLKRVRAAGIQICCGGIIGMGETIEQRCGLLVMLASQQPHPESVPINALVPVQGTPLGDARLRPVETTEMVRMIATARIVMPRSMVRLAAGRLGMSEEAQLLCLLAGANSIFFGDRLLTTDNPSFEQDMRVLAKAGLAPLAPHAFRPNANT